MPRRKTALSKTNSINNDEVPGYVSQVVRSSIGDLKEISKKSNKDLETIVEMYTGKMLERLEANPE